MNGSRSPHIPQPARMNGSPWHAYDPVMRDLIADLEDMARPDDPEAFRFALTLALYYAGVLGRRE